MFAFSAAGFIATSTFGASPGVTMSWSEMCTWKADTPAIVPAGARISAGKFGQGREVVAERRRELVNRSPTSCMPSPESPANRITTWSSVSTPRADVVSTVTVDHQLSAFLCVDERYHAIGVAPTRVHRPRAPPLYRRASCHLGLGRRFRR